MPPNRVRYHHACYSCPTVSGPVSHWFSLSGRNYMCILVLFSIVVLHIFFKLHFRYEIIALSSDWVRLVECCIWVIILQMKYYLLVLDKKLTRFDLRKIWFNSSLSLIVGVEPSVLFSPCLDLAGSLGESWLIFRNSPLSPSLLILRSPPPFCWLYIRP